MRTILVMGVMAAIFVACAANWDDAPASFYAPSAQYPCGILGVVCSNAPPPVGATCCTEGETCGGNPGCPAGYCCNVRDFNPAGLSRDDAGAVFDGGRVVIVREPVHRWAQP